MVCGSVFYGRNFDGELVFCFFGDIEMSKRNKVVILKQITRIVLKEGAVDDMDKLARKYGGQTEVMVKALGLFRYVDQHMEEGWVLALESEKENIRKEITAL